MRRHELRAPASRLPGARASASVMLLRESAPNFAVALRSRGFSPPQCDNRTVDPVDLRIAEAVGALRYHGAVFAYLHGSRAWGTAREDSDVDIAAYFHGAAPQAFKVLLPAGVDLLVLNRAPLELAGRVALHAKLLFAAGPRRPGGVGGHDPQDLSRRAAASAAGPPGVRESGAAPW